jgi:hypothetical protein
VHNVVPVASADGIALRMPVGRVADEKHAAVSEVAGDQRLDPPRTLCIVTPAAGDYKSHGG